MRKPGNENAGSYFRSTGAVLKSASMVEKPAETQLGIGSKLETSEAANDETETEPTEGTAEKAPKKKRRKKTVSDESDSA